MDENYLDNLLNEMSLDKEIDYHVENELDDQIQSERAQSLESESLSRDDMFNMDLEQDVLNGSIDADLQFSEEQMNELDNLDDLADLDMGDLDFSDIDFNDLDVTNLEEVGAEQDLDSILKEFDGDLEIADHFDDMAEVPSADIPVETEEVRSQKESAFDTDAFLNHLEEDETAEQPYVEPLSSESAGTDMMQQEETEDLDDLFSLLDLEENAVGDKAQYNTSDAGAEAALSEQNAELLDMLDDIDELPTKDVKKKKSFMTLLFGEPDEDGELSQEELDAIEKKKAEKKAKKAAEKQKKEEKKTAAKTLKDAKSAEKRKNQEEKKKVRAVKKANRQKEEASQEPEKPFNKAVVVFVFSLFLGGTLLFFLGTNNFNYTLAIQKAGDYFNNQKYHNAYDEIKGVDVREKDKELKDRIYTVMYVERLYESYENNLQLNRQRKALDSLLRGVNKYYEYYEEAEQLGIVEDLDYCFAQIQTALQDNYGITLEQALSMNELENYEYAQAVDSYTANRDGVE